MKTAAGPSASRPPVPPFPAAAAAIGVTPQTHPTPASPLSLPPAATKVSRRVVFEQQRMVSASSQRQGSDDTETEDERDGSITSSQRPPSQAARLSLPPPFPAAERAASVVKQLYRAAELLQQDARFTLDLEAARAAGAAGATPLLTLGPALPHPRVLAKALDRLAAALEAGGPDAFLPLSPRQLALLRGTAAALHAAGAAPAPLPSAASSSPPPPPAAALTRLMIQALLNDLAQCEDEPTALSAPLLHAAPLVAALIASGVTLALPSPAAASSASSAPPPPPGLAAVLARILLEDALVAYDAFDRAPVPGGSVAVTNAAVAAALEAVTSAATGAAAAASASASPSVKIQRRGDSLAALLVETSPPALPAALVWLRALAGRVLADKAWAVGPAEARLRKELLVALDRVRSGRQVQLAAAAAAPASPPAPAAASPAAPTSAAAPLSLRLLPDDGDDDDDEMSGSTPAPSPPSYVSIAAAAAAAVPAPAPVQPLILPPPLRVPALWSSAGQQSSSAGAGLLTGDTYQLHQPTTTASASISGAAAMPAPPEAPWPEAAGAGGEAVYAPPPRRAVDALALSSGVARALGGIGGGKGRPLFPPPAPRGEGSPASRRRA